MKWLALAIAACGSGASIAPDNNTPIATALPAHHPVVLDDGIPSKRMVPVEAFLRSYLMWFGGLMPDDIQRRAHTNDLFDRWVDYLASLGLPDYQVDMPRATQSNPVMLATLGRLGEALCVKSIEHDARAKPDKRVVFAFEPKPDLTRPEFATRLDVLHRTFLGYPLDLAPASRLDRFYTLYRQVASRHPSGALSPDELGWVAVCTALVQHPEAGLY